MIDVEVVGGLIVRDGRVLLTQRRADKSHPLTWECPGGKVEGMHESHHDALRREMREEIGIAVGGIHEHAIYCGVFPMGANDLLWLLYPVLSFEGEPAPQEGQPGMRWFTPHEMMTLALTPGNSAARDVIADAVLRRAAL